MAEKVPPSVQAVDTDGVAAAVAKNNGTSDDMVDMLRMGKQQEMKRNFRFISVFGFIAILMSTWEAQFTVSTFALINGGTGGAIWVYLGAFFGFLAAIASLAEMGSMAPTTGGQYHWVSEFAPRSHQRILSYLVGWLCVLGWQTGGASVGYIIGTIIQGLVVLNYPSYEPTRWQATLIIWAVLTVTFAINLLFSSKLPLLETGLVILHVVGFVALIATLWACGTPQPAHQVFFTFNDGGLWGNIGLSCLVGLLSPVFSFLGPDGAAHVSEELRDASKTLPRAMVWTCLLNGAMGWVMLISLCFMIDNLDDVLATPYGFPFISILFNVTNSHAGTSILATLIIVMSLASLITGFATASRQLWAFSRDQGTPFSAVLAHVHPGWQLPLNSLIFTYAFSMAISCINFGSSVAFDIITSLTTAALLISYFISISCIAVKRLRNEPLLPRKWSLGRWGLPVNIVGALFLLLCFIVNFFPESPVNLTPQSFNWNILAFGVVVSIAAAYFVVQGRKTYVGPVAYVRKDI